MAVYVVVTSLSLSLSLFLSLSLSLSLSLFIPFFLSFRCRCTSRRVVVCRLWWAMCRVRWSRESSRSVGHTFTIVRSDTLRCEEVGCLFLCSPPNLLARVLVTEANNDDGLPHTLEHLVFMGSKKYPFKGVLDIIANRSFIHSMCLAVDD